MLVRVEIGFRKGTIQDIEITAAKAMLADGRATLPVYGVTTKGRKEVKACESIPSKEAREVVQQGREELRKYKAELTSKNKKGR
jgi:hypothetical protein